MTVRVTDLTDEAPAGTVSFAWSCRGAESESIARRSHEDAPLPVLQPKENSGELPTAGAACSRMTASGMFPPVAQAVTVHSAAAPSWLVAWLRTILRQRSAVEICCTVFAPLCGCGCERKCRTGAVFVGAGVGVGELVAVDFTLVEGEELGEAEPVGLGEDFRAGLPAGLGEDFRAAAG